MSDKVNASPAAQKLARANQLDLGEIKGSGNGGQVTKPDVEKAIEAKSKPADPPVAGDGDQAEAAAAAARAAKADAAPADAAPAEVPPAPDPAPRQADTQPAAAPSPPPAPPEAEVGDQGETREITKLRDNLGVTWWCPFDDHSQPGEHRRCGRCGAERDGDGVAKLGDKVTAA